jgi:hypothetical protein
MAENDSAQYDPVKHRHILALPSAMLIGSLLIACLFEAILIRRVWIRPQSPIDGFSAFTVQFMALVPALLILMLRFGIGRGLRNGDVSPLFAGTLSLQLAVLLMIVYLAFIQLLTFAPH